MNYRRKCSAITMRNLYLALIELKGSTQAYKTYSSVTREEIPKSWHVIMYNGQKLAAYLGSYTYKMINNYFKWECHSISNC